MDEKYDFDQNFAILAMPTLRNKKKVRIILWCEKKGANFFVVRKNWYERSTGAGAESTSAVKFNLQTIIL